MPQVRGRGTRGVRTFTNQPHYHRPILDTTVERAMQLGMIGLGRMGSNMVKRLVAGGHDCVVFDRSSAAVQGLAQASSRIAGAASLQEFVAKLAKPRALWLM